MKSSADFVEEYLGVFIQHMIDAAPNSATGDNCRRAAELMIEAAVADERASWIERSLEADKAWAAAVNGARQAGYTDGVADEREECAAVAQELREMISKHHPMPEHRSSSAATTEAVRACLDQTETALDREWIGLRVVVWFLVSMWVLFGVWACLSGS